MKKRILIIEDNKDLQIIFRTFFEKEAFEVFIAQDGIDGISQAVGCRPDVILLDIMMAQMDGYEVLKAIKNNSSLPAKIVINTNLSQEKDKQKTLDMGADLFLVKSNYTPERVVEEVQKLLGIKKKSNKLPLSVLESFEIVEEQEEKGKKVITLRER